MNGDEEPWGRGVPELIAAYRHGGEDRADLFYEARYLRYLPGAIRGDRRHACHRDRGLLRSREPHRHALFYGAMPAPVFREVVMFL